MINRSDPERLLRKQKKKLSADIDAGSFLSAGYTIRKRMVPLRKIKPSMKSGIKKLLNHLLSEIDIEAEKTDKAEDLQKILILSGGVLKTFGGFFVRLKSSSLITEICSFPRE